MSLTVAPDVEAMNAIVDRINAKTDYVTTDIYARRSEDLSLIHI